MGATDRERAADAIIGGPVKSQTEMGEERLPRGGFLAGITKLPGAASQIDMAAMFDILDQNRVVWDPSVDLAGEEDAIKALQGLEIERQRGVYRTGMAGADEGGAQGGGTCETKIFGIDEKMSCPSARKPRGHVLGKSGGISGAWGNPVALRDHSSWLRTIVPLAHT